MRRQVLIADDHPLIRYGLRCLLRDCDDIGIGGEASDGHETLRMVRGPQQWDLLVMDLSMPGRNGLELIKLVKAAQPRLPVLVFSEFLENLYAVRAIRAGASGYLSKKAGADDVLLAMRRIAAGSVFFSERVTELLATHPGRDAQELPHTRLTDREYGIFSRIVNGARLTDIADELSLSVKTVSTHKSNILEKMTLGGQVELVRYAIEHKLLDAAG
ncbi:response regulator [Caenimonas terrae]|uniref:Response regulator n=1 Tax=Caenimonas terrae TaxID=696074 RepID=A0ABW0NK34_9BURK